MYICLIPLISSIFLALNLQHTYSKPINTTHHEFDKSDNDPRIPTPQESAILARRILRLTPMATFSTIFPVGSESNASSSKELSLQKALPPNHIQDMQERRPQGLENTPIGLIDYVADCEASGNPTVLAINIATTFKNVAAGSNVSISFSWTPPHILSWSGIFSKQQYAAKHSAANLPRFALFGNLERIDAAEVEELSIKECFTKTHPDAKSWLPGNKVHTSEWRRFVVEHIYWIGGFGDQAYIGWIPVDLWKNVWDEDIDRARLPGEKKVWKEIINKWLGDK